VDPRKVFLVEQYRADLTPQGVLDEAAHVADGGGVSVLGCALITDDETCFAFMEADSIAAVETAFITAGVSFERIVEAVWVTRPTPRVRSTRP
jgi:hypothetical protein